MIQVIILFLTIFEGSNKCNYQSFGQSQLESNDFCGEQQLNLGDSYAFGIWIMYAPLRRNLQNSQIKTYFNTSTKDDGYHLLNFQINGSIQTLMYQGRVAQNNFTNYYINITVLQITKQGVIKYTFPNYCLNFEGRWIFMYFAYYKLTNYNIAFYSPGDNTFTSTVANYPFYKPTSKGLLQYGNQGQFSIGSTKLNLNIFPGRISIPSVMDTVYFFYYYQGSAFVNYITSLNCLIPSPCLQIQQKSILDKVYTKSNLTVKSYETDIPNFNYSIEFWLKRNSIIDFPQYEIILSYGFPFKDIISWYRSLFLICKSYQGRLLLLHLYQTYYIMPNDISLGQTDVTYEIPVTLNLSYFSSWIYFRYDFLKKTDRSVLLLSVARPLEDIYHNKIEIVSEKYAFQYSNYQSILTLFSDSRFYNPDQYKLFGGQIANFRLSYCQNLTQNLSSSVNLNCHPLCKICRGPTKWDCTSCYSEQNRYLLMKKNICMCLIKYREYNGQLVCKLYNPQITYISKIVPITIKQCNYGEFELWENLRFLGCFSCPYINLNHIQCVNCLLNSEKWWENPICDLQYYTTDEIYYSLIPFLQPKYYLINNQRIKLCQGCLSNTQCFLNHYLNKQGECIECTTNCLNCIEKFCKECKQGYYLNGTVCSLCSSNCLTCIFDSQNPVCTSCISQYIVSKGECIPCGKNCDVCELRQSNNRIYKKCLKCLPNTYISLDGETCYENTVPYCRQPFQFHLDNLMISTIFFDFEPQFSQNIKIGCAYCQGYAYIKKNDTSIFCESLQEKVMSDCAFLMQIQSNLHCIFGNLQALYTDEFFCLLQYPHCEYCITGVNQQGICFVCENGYYNDYYTSFCLPCPSECLSCYQSDYSKIIKLVIYPMFDLLYQMNYIAYLQRVQDPNTNNIQIYCYECQLGYTLYQDKCILDCPFNCQECEVVNFRNKCIACLQMNEYSYYQIQDGQCIQCPTNCKLCSFRTNNEKLLTNPYFYNVEYDFFTNPCVVPFDESKFYDQQIKQFIECVNCEKQVNFDFEVFCNAQSQIGELKIQIDQLFNNKFYNYLSEIETQDYYLYLNKEYVKQINYKFIFQPNSICIINNHSYFTSTLQQNVFNLLQLNFIIEGNNSTFLLNGNITLSNFTSITIKNLIFQNTGLVIENIKQYSIYLENITITSFNKDNSHSFLFNNASIIKMYQISIINMNYNSFSSIIVINNTLTQVELSGQNLKIIASQFKTAPLLIIQTNSNEVHLLNILIKESQIIKAQFSNLLQKLELKNLIALDTQITNSNGFFEFQKFIIMDQLILENCSLTNSTFVKTSAGFILQNSSFKNLSFFGTSTLFHASNFKEKTDILFYNNYFIDLFYQERQAILFVQQSNQIVMVTFRELEMTRVSLNPVFMKQDYQESIDQSIIDLDCTSVSLYIVNIQRGLGFTEFAVRNAALSFINSVITIDKQYYYKSISNRNCPSDVNTVYYKTFIFLEDIVEATFNQLEITKIILYDSNFIDFSQSKVNSSFLMTECNFTSNIIHQTKIHSFVSLLSIQSLSDVQLLQNQYEKNLLAVQAENNANTQGLLFKISSKLTIISACHFQSNMIINGSSSIFKIDSKIISIEQSFFNSNSIFQYETLKQFLIWGFEDEVYEEELEKLFTVSSNGGNGNLQGQQINISNSVIQNSYSKQGGAFAINLLENGQLNVQQSQFQNLNVNLAQYSNGGCFYVSSNSYYMKIDITQSIFSEISSRLSGGIIHISTSTSNPIINIQNSSFSNIFALQGSISDIQQSQKGNPQFFIKNCQIVNEEIQFQIFINKITSLNSIELSQLINSFSLISFVNGMIRIENMTITQYQYLQLFNFQNSVFLKGIKIFNLVINRPLLLFNKITDPLRIQILELNIINCTFISQIEYNATTLAIPIVINSPTCANNDPPQQLRSAGYQSGNQNFQFLSNIEQAIEGVIIFNNFNEQDLIIMNSIIIQVNCSVCLFGVLSFKNLQSPNMQITGLTITKSQCGIFGCLFMQSSSFRLLTEFSYRSNIFIKNLLCYNNQAEYGGCLYLQNQQINIIKSEMINNTAQKGGAIFIDGSKSILDSNSLLIVNNTANEGSGIYANDAYLYKNDGLIFFDNSNTTLTKRPSHLQIQFYSQEVLTPQITFMDKYHTEVQILTLFGDEVTVYVPTGIEIKNYRRFDMKSNQYNGQSQIIRLFAFTDTLEKINLSGTYCNCWIIDEYRNKYQNLTNQDTFYFKKSSYILDDLILYIPQDNKKQYRLEFWCNSIYIPIMEDKTIIGQKIDKYRYHQNYTLSIKIKPYECQLGEYHANEADYCHQCQVDRLQYSVSLNSSFCSIKNEEIMNEITPAQVKLNPGYWKYQITSIVFDICLNKENICIGGWNFGNDLCAAGYIGALCEQCDYYNIRGQGSYTQTKLYECQLCDVSQFVNFILPLGSILMYYIYLFRFILLFCLLKQLINGLKTNYYSSLLSRLQMQHLREAIKWQFIKQIIQFFQLISVIAELNPIYDRILLSLIYILGNTFEMNPLNICKLTGLNINVVYMNFIQNSLCLLAVLLIGQTTKFIFFKFINIKYFYYLAYFLYGNSIIRSGLKILSFRRIQDEFWIYQNVAYLYNTRIHLNMLACFLPILLAFSLIFPAFQFARLQKPNRFLIRNYGIWLCAFKKPIYESIKIMILIIIDVAVFLIDGHQTLRCLIAFLIVAVQYLNSSNKTLYVNIFQNNFEQYLLQISLCIMVLSMFERMLHHNILQTLIYLLFLLSFVLMIRIAYRLQFQIIYKIKILFIRNIAQMFPTLLKYTIFKKYSEQNENETKRRIKMLKNYIKHTSWQIPDDKLRTSCDTSHYRHKLYKINN